MGIEEIRHLGKYEILYENRDIERIENLIKNQSMEIPKFAGGWQEAVDEFELDFSRGKKGESHGRIRYEDMNDFPENPFGTAENMETSIDEMEKNQCKYQIQIIRFDHRRRP